MVLEVYSWLFSKRILAINLRCAKVSQTDSFTLFANLASLFGTRFKALTWPSLYGSQHTAPYSSIGLIKIIWVVPEVGYMVALFFVILASIFMVENQVAREGELGCMTRGTGQRPS